MSTLSKKLVAACLVTALSMVMYGCGGGGSSSSTPDPTDDTSQADMDAAAATMAANDAAAAATMAAATAQAAVDAATLEDSAAAQAAATAATATAAAATAAAAAVDAADSATVDAANMAATAANDAATAANDAATALNTAEAAAVAAAAVAAAAAAAAAVIADTKAAGTKSEAIDAEAAVAVADDEGLGGTGAPTAGQVEDEYNLNIKYGETSIVVEGAAEADNETFMQAMDFGNGRTMHTRTMDADTDGNVVVEVAIVSTDIEAPTATAFAMVAGQELTVNLDDTNDTPTRTYEALEVTDTNRALVMSSAFTASTAATLTFSGDDPGDDMDEAFEAPGTYNGAMGTYMCNGAATDCTVVLSAMGMITSLPPGWVFIPDTGATSDVPDDDYLHYGFWLQRTTDEDGAVTYDEVQTFAGSSIPRSDTTGTPIGRATYLGGATGVYVHSITNPDGTEASATSGHFTADAELTAYFGQVPVSDTDSTGTIAPNLVDSISGTINNFMLSDHAQGPGWSVSLEQADIVLSNTGATPHVSGDAKGGGKDGNYQANFHGPTADAQPHSVVGEFNAFFSNGSVAGGFGARKDD